MGLPVLDDSLQSYLIEINRFPVLSRDEEHEISVRWYEKKDIDAAHTLVTSNLKFVVKLALEYRDYGCNLKDMVQEGNIGLMTAVKKFNPYRGCRLITYAAWWIRSFMQEYILRTKGLVKRSTKALKKRLFYKNRQEDPEKSPAGCGLTVEDGLYVTDISANDISLDSSINNADNEKTLIEKLTSPAPTQEETVSMAEEHAIVKRDVYDALALLSEKEQFVIEKRVMADEPESLQSIGKEMGLTRERVRQIENSALKKLRTSLSKETSPQKALYQ
ncbi:MAG: sigma-70 family RNA polymerase sigma factor [Deltaproteobacteria bacterium]|nr:sigma-70 family RNA polymerase sigma factor [Deltaproteobacteria bacterium]